MDGLIEVVLAEITQWQAAAASYERVGRHDDAARLRAEAKVLTEFLERQ